jgi:hypothetical protein
MSVSIACGGCAMKTGLMVGSPRRTASQRCSKRSDVVEIDDTARHLLKSMQPDTHRIGQT